MVVLQKKKRPMRFVLFLESKLTDKHMQCELIFYLIPPLPTCGLKVSVEKKGTLPRFRGMPGIYQHLMCQLSTGIH